MGDRAQDSKPRRDKSKGGGISGKLIRNGAPSNHIFDLFGVRPRPQSLFRGKQEIKVRRQVWCKDDANKFEAPATIILSSCGRLNQYEHST